MVQFYPWFIFYFPLFLGMVMLIMSLKQREIEFKRRMKLNHNISTWIYKNRVSKHFVIYLNFLCLSLFAVLFLYFASFLGCFLLKDLYRSVCRQNFANFYLTTPPPPSLTSLVFFRPYPQFSL